MGRHTRCCCDVPCPILLDEFERTPSTNLGGDWEEVSGDWEIRTHGTAIAGVLSESGTLNAKVVTTAKSTTEYMYVSLTLTDEYLPSGAIIRILINYKDEDEHYVVEFTETDTYIKTANGGSTLAQSDSGEGGWQFKVLQACINSAGQIVAEATDHIVMACVSVIPGGRRAGVGNGSTTEINVDTFVFEEHADTDPDCLSCCCHRCDDSCIPRTLNVLITSDDCSGLPNGNTFTVVHTWFCNNGKWMPGGGSNPDFGCWDPDPVNCGYKYYFHLFCSWSPNIESNCESWTLEMNSTGALSCDQQGLDDVGGGDIVQLNPVECSCNPFYLKFCVTIGWDPVANCCYPGGVVPGVGEICFEVTD